MSWYHTGYYTGRYEAMKEICNALSSGEMKFPSVTMSIPQANIDGNAGGDNNES
jgi:hypothetical protein